MPLIKPTMKEALLFWAKLGFISFGGPTAQIAIMHDEVVVRRQWVSEEEFLKGLNFCVMLPGPEAQQLATYLGWRLHGFWGGVTSGGLFILPAIFILWGLSWIYAMWGSLPQVGALFKGLEVAVVVLVGMALMRMGKKVLKTRGLQILSFVSLVGALVLPGSWTWWVLSLLIYSWWRNRGVLSNVDSSERKIGYWGGKMVLQISQWMLIGFSPVLLLGVVCGWESLWFKMGAFFTKVALVTFGGAYAILPYVAQQAVGHFQWLSASQMMTGMALAETTPGPLIMVLQYVGFMAGWLHSGNQVGALLGATFGSLITVWSTFFPSFVFILVGAPYLDRFHAIPLWDYFLKILSAAVIGFMAAMALGFAHHVLGTWSWISLEKLVLALVLGGGMLRYKWGAMTIVLVAALVGWLLF